MKHSSIKFYQLFAAGVIAVSLLACTRNLDNSQAFVGESSLRRVPVHSNSNEPAAQIAASEKLFIPDAVDLPENFPSGNSRIATYFAEGVQKYKAQAKAGSNPVVYEWVFVAPQADLYDATNAKIGTHGAGPFWAVSAADIIFAQHFTPSRTAPSPDGESIDWLLLKPKEGTTPTGLFAGVDYIQRIATKGGKAPSIPPIHAAETAEVRYKTIYRFSKKNP